MKMKKVLIFIILFLSLSSCDTFRTPEKQAMLKEQKQGQEQEVQEDVIEIGDWEEEAYEEEKASKVKVGILLPLSGKAQKIGDIMLQSAQLALFESNKDNMLLKSYDTKGTPFGALNAVNQAIEDKVDIILGPLFSSSTEAIMDKAYENNITVLSFSNNQMLLNDKNIYLMGFMPEQEIERIVSYAMNEGKYAFSALVPNDAYGALISRILKETVERKDGKIVKIDYYSKRDRSLDKKVKGLLDSYAISDRVYEEYEKAKELSKLNKDEEQEPVEFVYEEEDKIYADAILIPDGGKRLNEILDLMASYSTDERQYQLLGTSKWENEANYRNQDLYNSWFVSPDPDEYKDFEERFYKAYGVFPIRVASLAYDAVNAVKKVYQKSKDETIDRSVLTSDKGYKGIDGSFRFLPNGIVERRFAILEIEDEEADVIDKSFDWFLEY